MYRLLMPMVNEAFFLLSEGVGSAEDIDRSMRLGTNMQLGPLKLADQIGGRGDGVELHLIASSGRTPVGKGAA